MENLQYVQGNMYALHYRCWVLSYSLNEYVPLCLFASYLFHTTVKRKQFNCSKYCASHSKPKKMLLGELVLFLLWKGAHFCGEQGLGQLFRL